MSNDALVSVIMPTYNDKESFIREAINSVLSQTYSNLELIIADDSTDERTRVIIDEYVKKDERVQVVRSKEKMGICKALNTALSIAQGEYIAHMDADDVSYPNRLALQMKLFENSDVAVVGGQIIKIDVCGREISTPSRIPCTDEIIKVEFKKGRAQIANPTSIIRKNVIDRIGGYEELYKCSEDYDLWYRIATLGYKFANVPETVIKYRIHGNNAHIKLSETQSLLCCMTLLKYACGFSGRMNNEQYEKYLYYISSNIICKLLTSVMRPSTLLSRIVRRLDIGDFLFKKSIDYFKRRKKNF